MRKKNLILLTSITGLLLTLTPTQALAQESTAPTTSQSQTDNDKKEDNKDDDIRLASEDKCHWNNEIPVPENKLLKLFYDASIKEVDKEIGISYDTLPKKLKDLVDNGEMSQKEAQYRAEFERQLEHKRRISSYLHGIIQFPVSKDEITNKVNMIYNNPDNIDDMVQEIIDSYSLKDLLEYVEKYSTPDIHGLYVNKELRDKYQKEFDELDNTLEYDKNKLSIWTNPEDFKVIKKLEKFSSEEEQIQRFIDLYTWLSFFKVKGVDEVDDTKLSGYTYYLSGDILELYKQIKDKDLDNDDFYSEVEKYVKEHQEYDQKGFGPLTVKLREYDINWYSQRSAKVDTFDWMKIEKIIENPNFDVPYNVTCDDEETPGEDTNNPTNPETPGDKETTTPTTKTTSKQDKPSNKTSNKSSDKTATTTTPNNENKEDISTSTNPEESTTPNQVKTPKQVNTPNNPNQEFTPVKNTKPGTFNGGVSSNVEGEEISEGGKVDTGSPTTSILNKIRTIF